MTNGKTRANQSWFRDQDETNNAMKTAPNKKINKMKITNDYRTCLLIQGYKSLNPHSLQSLH